MIVYCKDDIVDVFHKIVETSQSYTKETYPPGGRRETVRKAGRMGKN